MNNYVESENDINDYYLEMIDISVLWIIREDYMQLETTKLIENEKHRQLNRDSIWNKS